MKKSLTQNAVYNILYKLVTALYPLVAVTYVSHILQAERMGMVSYAQNIVSYFAVFAALGLPSYGVREIAKLGEKKQERSKIFFELFIINALATTLSYLAYLALVNAVPKFYSNKSLYMIAGIQILLNYINVDWFFQGIEEYKYISIRSIVVKIAALILLPVFIHTPDDYINYALIYCLAIAGNNIFNIVKIRNYLEYRRIHYSILPHLKAIVVLLGVSIAVEIYVMIDTTMLGIFCNDEIVGCYSNAIKLTRMVNSIAAALGAVLMPRLSKIYQDKDLGKYNELVNSGVKVMLIIAIPAAVGLIVLSSPIVYLFFGESFAQAIPLLRILALMIPVVVCNTILGGQVLVTVNRENKYIVCVSAAAVINVVLNGLFIPRFGATSAAVASLISEMVALGMYLWVSKDIIRVRISRHFWYSLFIPLGVYVLLSQLLIARMHLGNFLSVCINVLVCFVVYFGLGIAMKNEVMMLGIAKVKSMGKGK